MGNCVSHRHTVKQNTCQSKEKYIKNGAII